MTLVESTASSQSQKTAGAIFATDRRLAKRLAKQRSFMQKRNPSDLSWRVDALCRDSNPELFFPIGSTGRAVAQIEKAQAVCLNCSAREACLEYALETNQDSGVWGATTAEYRRMLRRNYLTA